MSTKSGRRNTATDETRGGAASASRGSLMAAKHTVRAARIRACPARDAIPSDPVEAVMSEAREAASLRALEEVAARAAAAGRLEPPGGEAVLRSVVDVAVTLLGGEAASVGLHGAATDRLVIRVAAGPQGDGAVGISFAAATGIAGYVFTTG